MLSITELFLQARALPDCGNSGEKKCEITRICQTREMLKSWTLSLLLQSAAVRRDAPDMSVYGTMSLVCMVAVCSYQSAVRVGDTNHGECSPNILRWPVSNASTSLNSMQQSPSSEANSSSASRESPRILCSLQFHWCVCKGPPFGSIQSQTNSRIDNRSTVQTN